MISCPRCGGGLRRVSWVPEPFLGCVNYPKCRGSLPLSAGLRTFLDVKRSLYGMVETLKNGELAEWPTSKIMSEINRRLNRRGILRNSDLKTEAQCRVIEKALLDICWTEMTKIKVNK